MENARLLRAAADVVLVRQILAEAAGASEPGMVTSRPSQYPQ
jgi:hypothetical protein